MGLEHLLWYGLHGVALFVVCTAIVGWLCKRAPIWYEDEVQDEEQ